MDSSTRSSRSQHANHLPENPFPARRPVQVQPHGHDTGALSAVCYHCDLRVSRSLTLILHHCSKPLPVNAAGNLWHDSRWDDVHPMPFEDIAAQVQQQRLQYIDMGHYIPVPPAVSSILRYASFSSVTLDRVMSPNKNIATMMSTIMLEQLTVFLPKYKLLPYQLRYVSTSLSHIHISN